MNSILARFRVPKPGPSEVVFALVLLILLIGGRHALFNDPGTLWHLRLGRDILAAGEVPRSDTLTFTRAHATWVDQSWAFDVLLAFLHDHGGWSPVIALTTLALAGLYAAVARGLIRDGHSAIVAVVVTLLVTAIGSIHFLIRPHLFTLVLVYATLRVCQKQHENGGWTIALVPVFTAFLANLHGGFLALPMIVATAAVGHAVSGPWDRSRRRNVVKFALAFVASGLAALLNPYGLGLYRHVGHLLFSSGVTGLIDEYQPAPFGKAEARVLEMVVLAFVGLPVITVGKVGRYQVVHLLVWLHLALTSIRNAPLFGLAAAPALAALIEGLPISFQTAWKEPSRRLIWIPLAAMVPLALCLAGVSLGGYDQQKWPFMALKALNHQPTAARLFHEQDWGGLIAAESRPVRASYLDDRFELFGREAILEYVDALTGGPAWDEVCRRDRIELVWIKPNRGLAKRLMEEPDWKVIYRDKISVLFGKRLPVTLTRNLVWSG